MNRIYNFKTLKDGRVLHMWSNTEKFDVREPDQETYTNIPVEIFSESDEMESEVYNTDAKTPLLVAFDPTTITWVFGIILKAEKVPPKMLLRLSRFAFLMQLRMIIDDMVYEYQTTETEPQLDRDAFFNSIPNRKAIKKMLPIKELRTDISYFMGKGKE